MTKRADQLGRIEAALTEILEAQSSIAAALDPDVKGSLAALLIAEAKGARQSAEASFAGVQALASVATAKPGLGELAGAVAANTEAVRAVPAAVAAVVLQVAPDKPAGVTAGSVAEVAARPAERRPAGSAGTAGQKPKAKGM